MRMSKPNPRKFLGFRVFKETATWRSQGVWLNLTWLHWSSHGKKIRDHGLWRWSKNSSDISLAESPLQIFWNLFQKTPHFSSSENQKAPWKHFQNWKWWPSFRSTFFFRESPICRIASKRGGWERSGTELSVPKVFRCWCSNRSLICHYTSLCKRDWNAKISVFFLSSNWGCCCD